VVDYALYLLLNSLLKANVPALDSYISFLPVRVIARIALAALLARVVSSLFNYFVNKKLVFSSREGFWGTFARYVSTVVFIVCMSAWLTSSLHDWFGVSDNLIKMPVDIALFFLSYYIQRRWVFGGGAVREKALREARK
jgi:dolichol-phosphate mannosyltransferase